MEFKWKENFFISVESVEWKPHWDVHVFNSIISSTFDTLQLRITVISRNVSLQIYLRLMCEEHFSTIQKCSQSTALYFSLVSPHLYLFYHPLLSAVWHCSTKKHRTYKVSQVEFDQCKNYLHSDVWAHVLSMSVDHKIFSLLIADKKVSFLYHHQKLWQGFNHLFRDRRKAVGRVTCQTFQRSCRKGMIWNYKFPWKIQGYLY